MATNTTNYGFKKPDESDFYDVNDQNNNWDLADEALKELDTPTFEDYTGDTEVPAAETALGNIKSKGKLATLLSNIKAFCKGCCTLAMIVNNCVTDNPNMPLSAAQGKTLMDLYTKLNSDILSLNSRLTNKKIVFNDEWIIGFSTYGSATILIQIPLDNPDKKTPKLNITSAKIFTHAGWEDFTETAIMTVTETFIEISCSGHTPENIDIGNCCIIKLIGTIEI